jgi:hypothetical protein
MSAARCSSSRRRTAFSIPMVLLFCAIMVVVLMAFVQTRINMKQQTKITFRQIKAHYLAQSGIQHALLKLRILPLESYDAAAVARGICPFLAPNDTPPTVPDNPAAHLMLNNFISDVDTAVYPVGFSDFPNWKYKAVQIKALSADKEGDSQTHSIQIVVDGELNENYKGQMLTTTDEVTRIVKITRGR